MNEQTSQPRLDAIVSLHDAIRVDVVNGKEVPLLVFPDRTTIHLAPYKIPDNGQDPAKVLRQWLFAWCGRVARDPLRDAWSDLAQWARLAEWQREEMPHNQNVCPNQTGIEYTRSLQGRIQDALRSMRTDEEMSG